ncbi:hypothetical protein QYE76_044017 [Lolium multiflorum]|uniref:Uncharacterized protein n=1 Tax=Lolium multiflorum TaxID=4521 RepID=A0AAD8TI14_LOLMU|nr:hypothetical protein QYE76_044017 [Lolium multiflorum]
MASTKKLQERVVLGRTAWILAEFAILFLLLALIARRAASPQGEDRGATSPWLGTVALVYEAWFAFVWALNMNCKWSPVRFDTYPDNLLPEELPAMDMFVTTADPLLEPPLITVNTVLSLLALDYPDVGKLACYVSDDGCSPVTCYALREAAEFAAVWVPFCKRHGVGVRAPFMYFASAPPEIGTGDEFMESWEFMKSEYEKLVTRIENADEGFILRDAEFAEFIDTERRNHPTIVKILWDNTKSRRTGQRFPNLVYVSREKNPKHYHNFKAGAMNVLTRVSAVMTNAPIMLNVDCDMFANNPQVALHAMCLLLGFDNEIESGFVQTPQKFYGALKDDPFGNQLEVGFKCAILCGLESDLQKRFEHHDPHELMNELKAIFETHAAVECYEASKHFFSCMMEEGSSVSEHMLAMTGHAKKLSDLGIVIPNRLGINRVLQSLPPSYKNFVMNYNMQNMNKELPELFGMLKAAEIEIKKEHQVLMVNKTTVSRNRASLRENSRRVARKLPRLL